MFSQQGNKENFEKMATKALKAKNELHTFNIFTC
jgi:hypothetical protein